MAELLVKEKYLNTIGELISIENKVGGSTENAESLKSVVEKLELLIPTVGVFSAGKSSLLNSFIGRPILPINVLAETAMATELHFSEREYAVAYLGDAKNTVTKEISLEESKTPKPDWKHLKLYINSQNLKNIEPLVLVDMPGFGSTKDAHDSALNSYLYKGTHYLVLIPVKAGTVPQTMVRHLQNVMEFGKTFSVFISQSNLKAPRDVELVVNEVRNQFDMQLDLKVDPIPLTRDASKGFVDVLNAINPNLLFENAVKSPTLELIDDIDTFISGQISALRMNNIIQENSRAELDMQIKRVEKRCALMKQEVQSHSYEEATQRIANAAGNAVSNNVDSLVEMAMRGQSSDEISRQINDIVQNALIPEIKNVFQNMTDKINADIRLELKDAQSIFKNLGNENFIAKVSSFAESWGDTAKSNLKLLVGSAQKVVDSKMQHNAMAYKVIAGALGIATNFISPVLEIVIMFLPEIIAFLAKSSKEKAQRESYTKQILNYIPKIEENISEKLIPLFKEQNENAILAISEQYQSKIDSLKKSVETAEQYRENLAEAERRIADLEECKEKLQAIREAL